jgi:DNA-binding MarR family transcriptional regulator
MKGLVTVMERHTRRYHIRRLTKEIENAAGCLSAGRAAISEKTGLNAEYWRALAVIDRSSYVLSISDLARQLRRSRQSAHPLAVGLERAGWIRFLPNRDDRRLLQMEITPSGKTMLNLAEGRFNMWLLLMAYDLGDREVQVISDTLRDVRERLTRARDHA